MCERERENFHAYFENNIIYLLNREYHRVSFAFYDTRRLEISACPTCALNDVKKVYDESGKGTFRGTKTNLTRSRRGTRLTRRWDLSGYAYRSGEDSRSGLTEVGESSAGMTKALNILTSRSVIRGAC